MARHPLNIDRILRQWPYKAGEVNTRLVPAAGDREVIQMRIEMGLLQMEIEGRPDGQRPHGADTYFDHLLQESFRLGDELTLSEDQCDEADREFVQFYHRRICWLSLREFHRAVRDADHTLAFMDFCRDHSPDEGWTQSHEQYRPFVLFHRVQAAALAALVDSGPEDAIHELNDGLDQFRRLFEQYDAGDQYEDDELVRRLVDLRESLRRDFEVGRTLDEQLAEAIASEQYELAAQIRDKIAARNSGQI